MQTKWAKKPQEADKNGMFRPNRPAFAGTSAGQCWIGKIF